MTKRAWNELVESIEEEISEGGPIALDDRKLRFLEVAYLRDIRDQLVKTGAVRPIYQVPPRSSWDVDEGEHEDSGDTRPFRFSDELRAPRPRDPADELRAPRPRDPGSEDRKDKNPKKK